MFTLLMLLAPYTVEYYYYTSDNCAACTKQTPIIEKLNSEGYDFKIRRGSGHGVTRYPSIVVVVKERGKVLATIRLENRIWSRRELKIMVTTVRFLTR